MSLAHSAFQIGKNLNKTSSGNAFKVMLETIESELSTVAWDTYFKTFLREITNIHYWSFIKTYEILEHNRNNDFLSATIKEIMDNEKILELNKLAKIIAKEIDDLINKITRGEVPVSFGNEKLHVKLKRNYNDLKSSYNRSGISRYLFNTFKVNSDKMQLMETYEINRSKTAFSKENRKFIQNEPDVQTKSSYLGAELYLSFKEIVSRIILESHLGIALVIDAKKDINHRFNREIKGIKIIRLILKPNIYFAQKNRGFIILIKNNGYNEYGFFNQIRYSFDSDANLLNHKCQLKGYLFPTEDISLFDYFKI